MRARELMDIMDDVTAANYVAEPDRLYVVGSDGTIAWKSGLGPFFFDVESWHGALREEIEKGV